MALQDTDSAQRGKFGHAPRMDDIDPQLLLIRFGESAGHGRPTHHQGANTGNIAPFVAQFVVEAVPNGGNPGRDCDPIGFN